MFADMKRYILQFLLAKNLTQAAMFLKLLVILHVMHDTFFLIYSGLPDKSLAFIFSSTLRVNFHTNFILIPHSSKFVET